VWVGFNINHLTDRGHEFTSLLTVSHWMNRLVLRPMLTYACDHMGYWNSVGIMLTGCQFLLPLFHVNINILFMLQCWGKWRTEGGEVWGVFNLPLHRNSQGPPKSCQTQPDCEIAEFRTPTPEHVREKRQ